MIALRVRQYGGGQLTLPSANQRDRRPTPGSQVKVHDNELLLHWTRKSRRQGGSRGYLVVTLSNIYALDLYISKS